MLPTDLIDVQLHTHRHRTPRDHALFVREIHDNEDVIRKLRGAGRSLEHFCYPSGEYYGQFFEWLRECNVKYATTCVPNIATPKSEPMLLPRLVDTMLHTPLSFEAALTGFASLLPKRRKYRLDPERLAG
jgi:peptidoglycan/xylan/chitin deacetylase (PgdA/CDA1 family)